MTRSDPPERIWFLLRTSKNEFPSRSQVPESDVPDKPIWRADWSILPPKEKAQFGNNYAKYEDLKERQKAWRRGEFMDES
jgi:hypothetical protein